MKISQNQNGSSLILVLGLIVIVAAVGFAGYRVMNHSDKTLSTKPSPLANITVPQNIKSKADANQAAKALDAEAGQIENNLDGSQLDSALNSVL